MQHQRVLAFTLIELLIALLIISVLVRWAYLSGQTFVQRQQMTQYIYQILDTLEMARMT